MPPKRSKDPSFASVQQEVRREQREKRQRAKLLLKEDLQPVRRPRLTPPARAEKALPADPSRSVIQWPSATPVSLRQPEGVVAPVVATPPIIPDPPVDTVTYDPWRPVPRCCWCQSPFVQQPITGLTCWVCPTPACRERQLTWKLEDAEGKLFYVPLPRQVELEETIARQLYKGICIGGDRAGGKSRALRMIAYRYCGIYDNFTVLMLRRNSVDLELNHTKFAARDAPQFNAKYTANKLTFNDTRSELRFSHCQNDDDYKKYVGAEVDLLIFEQLEQFRRVQFTEISAATGRVRRDGWKGLLLAGENPGGPLSAFIDEFFITKDLDPRHYPNYDPAHYTFLKGDLEDNPYTDPEYSAFLAGIEPNKRAMYRFGSRDQFPGKFFSQFDKATHVVVRGA